jgi:hypothetical protein
VRHAHIHIGGLAIAVLLLIGVYDRFVQEERWWWDLTGRTPFHDVVAVPFLEPDGRRCVAVELTRRPGYSVASPALGVRATGQGGRTYRGDVKLLDGTPSESRNLPPGRVEVGPFCVEVRNPPPINAEIWVFYQFPDRIRPFLLASLEWEGAAPEDIAATSEEAPSGE